MLKARTLQGLYMFEPIDMHDTFETSGQFKHFATRAQKEMDDVIKRRIKIVGDLGIRLQ